MVGVGVCEELGELVTEEVLLIVGEEVDVTVGVGVGERVRVGDEVLLTVGVTVGVGVGELVTVAVAVWASACEENCANASRARLGAVGGRSATNRCAAHGAPPSNNKYAANLIPSIEGSAAEGGKKVRVWVCEE